MPRDWGRYLNADQVPIIWLRLLLYDRPCYFISRYFNVIVSTRMYIWYTDFITRLYFIFHVQNCIRCTCICLIVYFICFIVYLKSCTTDKSAMISINMYIYIYYYDWLHCLIFNKCKYQIWVTMPFPTLITVWLFHSWWSAQIVILKILFLGWIINPHISNCKPSSVLCCCEIMEKLKHGPGRGNPHRKENPWKSHPSWTPRVIFTTDRSLNNSLHGYV